MEQVLLTLMNIRFALFFIVSFALNSVYMLFVKLNPLLNTAVDIPRERFTFSTSNF